MLELRKRSLFSNEYIAEENGVVVAELSQSFWRNRGEIRVEGVRMRLKKRGILRDTFTLLDDDVPLVSVEQSNVIGSKLVFNCEGRNFEICRKAWYSSTLLVKCEGEVVGSVRSRGMFSSGAIAELPTDLSIAIRVFIAWIAMVRWAAAAAAAGA